MSISNFILDLQINISLKSLPLFYMMCDRSGEKEKEMKSQENSGKRRFNFQHDGSKIPARRSL
jgi:hypothetical protein